MELDRHTLDAIARAVVSGERGLGKEHDRLAGDVASLLINKLKALNAPGQRRVAHLKWNAPKRWRRVRDRYGDALLDRILARVDKHLGTFALMEKVTDD